MGDTLMTTNSLFRNVALASAALLVITFAQRTARADEVFIAGSTLGCFGVGCTPQASFTGLGFTFSSSTFATTTTSGIEHTLVALPIRIRIEQPGLDYNVYHSRQPGWSNVYLSDYVYRSSGVYGFKSGHDYILDYALQYDWWCVFGAEPL